jgi:pyridoxamine 5'-phosphate oxidase
MARAGNDRLSLRLRDLRVFEGELPVFDVDDSPEHPAKLFLDWLTEAIDAGVREPHAMTLSTVDAEGRPNSRVLILKGLDDGRWQFATSRTSRKGEELSHTPWVAASFYWPELGRQVRLRGRVLDAGAEDAARDFLARPKSSRAESLTGNQSQPLHRPEDLDLALEEARMSVESEPGLVPEHWALFHLVPDEVEFWQADPERCHVRLRYELIDQRWSRQRLWP